ncbi:hypothetical protein [Candidatus Planktophila versatilis]|jgi:hypothetical protein|uniref:hypothetical protein n=1 Tax=Candidatus Planktophila versatilis TaxID=1884905 RepID=UPI00167FE331|nr:hypothetical protein [Candidatus Planktophila versatilis]
MSDFEVIRSFVSNSDFSEEIKEALMQCIALEIQDAGPTEYLNLVKKLSSE